MVSEDYSGCQLESDSELDLVQCEHFQPEWEWKSGGVEKGQQLWHLLNFGLVQKVHFRMISVDSNVNFRTKCEP